MASRNAGRGIEARFSRGEKLKTSGNNLTSLVFGSEDLEIAVAPPEYVVLRNPEYYREGRSAKHPLDIRAIREVTGVDEAALAPWLERMGLGALWQEIKSAR